MQGNEIGNYNFGQTQESPATHPLHRFINELELE